MTLPISASRFPKSVQQLGLKANNFKGELPDFSSFHSMTGLYVQDTDLAGIVRSRKLPLSTLRMLFIGDNRTTVNLDRYGNVVGSSLCALHPLHGLRCWGGH